MTDGTANNGDYNILCVHKTSRLYCSFQFITLFISKQLGLGNFVKHKGSETAKERENEHLFSAEESPGGTEESLNGEWIKGTNDSLIDNDLIRKGYERNERKIRETCMLHDCSEEWTKLHTKWKCNTQKIETGIAVGTIGIAQRSDRTSNWIRSLFLAAFSVLEFLSKSIWSFQTKKPLLFGDQCGLFAIFSCEWWTERSKTMPKMKCRTKKKCNYEDQITYILYAKTLCSHAVVRRVSCSWNNVKWSDWSTLCGQTNDVWSFPFMFNIRVFVRIFFSWLEVNWDLTVHHWAIFQHTIHNVVILQYFCLFIYLVLSLAPCPSINCPCPPTIIAAIW